MSEAAISTEDRLARLFSQQGYVSYGSVRPWNIGDIIPPGDHGEVDIPCRVIGISTHAEFRRQLLGWGMNDGFGWEHYYRLEAAD